MRSSAVVWGMRITVVVVAAVFLLLLTRTTVVRGIASRAFSWLERPFTVVADETQGQAEIIFATRQELISELQTREQQVLQLAQTAAQWEAAQQERDEALALLDYAASAEQRLVSARVRVRASAEDAGVIIDVGRVDGVSVGEPVIVEDGVLYGVVAEVFSHTSRVLRLTDPQMVLGGRVLGDEGTTGIVEGGTGPVVSMSFVPQGSPVELSSLIVTSGTDPLVPAGLVIGLVNAIEEDPNAPFLTVRIEPLADMNRARVVGIVQSPL